MPQIRIWVYDGILASGVAGSIDVFTAANAVWAERQGDRRARTPLLQWRIESLDGKPVQTASGQIVSASTYGCLTRAPKVRRTCSRVTASS